MRTLFANVTRVFVVGITVAVAVAPARADKPRLKSNDAPAPQRMTFEDELVDGSTWHPDHEIIDAVRAVKVHPLIRIRATFVPEIIKSAEDL